MPWPDASPFRGFGAGSSLQPIFGQYRAPTGVSQSPSNRIENLDRLRTHVDAVSDKLGRRLSFLVAKPGLDGHSNGAEQIASRARDAGMDMRYDGIRLTPAEIVDEFSAILTLQAWYDPCDQYLRRISPKCSLYV